MRSSASECTSSSAPGGCNPSQRRTTSVERCRNQISGRMTMKKTRTGATTNRAVPSEWPSAIPFGTSSPMTTCRKVSRRYASTTASTVARIASNRSDSACSPIAPMASDVSVTPSCIAAMKCGGSDVIRQHLPRATVAWCQLDDARSARRHEAVFGRDEEGVHQDQAPPRRRAQRGSSRPVPVGVGTRRMSSSNWGQYRKPVVVPSAGGAALPDEPFQVRERLGDGETALGRLGSSSPEDVVGDLVGAPWLVAERRRRSRRAGRRVLDQLSGAAARVEDRLTVSGVDDPRRELDRPLERSQIVPERVRPALRVEAHRRRDSLQEMIAGDQHAVTEKAEVAVGVTGQLERPASRPPRSLRRAGPVRRRSG